jgi:hypothetical protein
MPPSIARRDRGLRRRRRTFTSANVAVVLRRRLPPALAALLAAVLLAGCSVDSPRRVMPSAGVLAPELRIVASVLECDPGGRAYCGSDIVVAGPTAVTSAYELRRLETQAIDEARWKRVAGQTKKGLAAVSPDGKVYLSYATGGDDLQAVDDGSLKRPRALVRALRAAAAHHQPVLSISLTPGP